MICSLLWGLAAGLVVVVAACGGSTTPIPMFIQNDAPVPMPTQTPGIKAPPDTVVPDDVPIVRVDEVDFPVDLALTPAERAQGLSGRDTMHAWSGMLFVYEKANRYVFWMKKMQFPLDMVWIGPDCRVVDISENVPFPDPTTPLEDLPRYSPDTPARFILEINGGESAARGIAPGDRVEFLGTLTGKYGC